MKYSMGGNASVPQVRAKDVKRASDTKNGWLCKRGLTNTQLQRRFVYRDAPSALVYLVILTSLSCVSSLIFLPFIACEGAWFTLMQLVRHSRSEALLL
eukprot:761192-Hanusia_phi.AAC.3